VQRAFVQQSSPAQCIVFGQVAGRQSRRMACRPIRAARSAARQGAWRRLVWWPPTAASAPGRGSCQSSLSRGKCVVSVESKDLRRCSAAAGLQPAGGGVAPRWPGSLALQGASSARTIGREHGRGSSRALRQATRREGRSLGAADQGQKARRQRCDQSRLAPPCSAES